MQGPNGPEPAVSPQLALLVEQSVRTAIHKVQAVSSTLEQQLDAHAQAFGRQITSLVERLRGESAEIERRLETSGGAPIPGSGRKGSSAIERSMEAHLAPPLFQTRAGAWTMRYAQATILPKDHGAPQGVVDASQAGCSPAMGRCFANPIELDGQRPWC